HGRPGEIVFSAGALTADTVAQQADDLAAIGRALAADGTLCVWSCHTASGNRGARLAAGLRAALGAPVATADRLVGAARFGGSWELPGLPRPPLTRAGQAAYPATLTNRTWTGTVSTNWSTGGNWIANSATGAPTATDTAIIGAVTSGPTLSGFASITLLSVLSGGRLTLTNGGHITATTDDGSASIRNAGSITLNGGLALVAQTMEFDHFAGGGVNAIPVYTLAAGTVFNDLTGVISGAGTIDARLVDNRGVLRSGGTGLVLSAVTVDNRGTLQADTGNFAVTGSLGNTGSVLVTGGNVTVANQLDNNAGGDILIGSGRTLVVHGVVNNNGSVGAQATIALSGGALLADGAAVTTAKPSVTNKAQGVIVGYGSIFVPETTITTTGSFIVFGGGLSNSGLIATSGGTLGIYGLLTNNGTVAVTGGDLDVAADTTNATGGQITIATGNTLDIAGTFTNSATVALAGGALAAASTVGIVNNAAGLIDGNGAIVLTLGSIANAGTISTSGGALTVTGRIVNTKSILVAGGDLIDTGTIVNNSGATILLNAGRTLAATGITNNSGGLITGAGALSAPTSGITNSGRMTLTGDLAAFGALVNTGTMTVVDGSLTETGALTSRGGGQITIAAGRLLSASGGIVNGDTTGATFSTISLTGGGLVSTSTAGISQRLTGRITGFGSLVAVAGSIGNAGTIITSGGALTISGSLTNSKRVDVGGGDLIGSSLTNNSGGSITLGGYRIVTTGDITNNTGGVISGVGTLATSVSSTINNAGGTITTTGAFATTGGLLLNTGRINVTGGDLAQTGALTNSINGLITIGPLLTLSATGGIVNGDSGTTASRLLMTNATVLSTGTAGIVVGALGQVTGYGALIATTGTVANAGTITTSGGAFAVTGPLSNSGTIQAIGGNIAASGAVTNAAGGSIAIDSGYTFSAAGNLVHGEATGAAASISLTNAVLSVGGSTGMVVGATGRITGFGSVIAGSIGNAGTIAASGGTLVLTGAVANTGLLDLGGGSLTDSGQVINNSGGVISIGTAFTLTAGTGFSNSSGGWINAAGALIAATGSIANAGTFTVADNLLAGGSFINTGTVFVSGGNLIGSGGLTNDAGGTISIGAGRTLSVGGVLVNGVPTGTYAYIYLNGGALSASSITDRGSAVISGYGVVNSSISASGTVIVGGGTMQINGAIGTAIAAPLFRIGAGTLKLADVVVGTGTLHPAFNFGGSANNGVLDLTGLSSANLANFSANARLQAMGGADRIRITGAHHATYTSSVLSVYNSVNTLLAALSFNGAIPPEGTVFTVSNDEVVICFLAGTKIATPAGERAVEALAIGDPVLTVDGRVAPVRWIGRQTVSARFADPLRVHPIRIAAGALGEGLPRRDLLVSPDHALLVDGILIQAGALVNGTSITREARVPDRFVYYHVELADHALILAEGVPAETFIDNVDRLAFDNWAEHEALYGADLPLVEMDLPRAKSYRQVPRRIRDRLALLASAVTLAA
ncbi:MAG: Hint domain-containing protein, partial [Proteobacteria bacterium]|nr:Hint domain-containing protein [Pseudomonadota bacterium]